MLFRSTRELLEKYTRATGIKKGYLIEQALLHHILALQELPADMIIPRKIVVSAESGRRIIEEITGASRPARHLKKLMTDAD